MMLSAAVLFVLSLQQLLVSLWLSTKEIVVTGLDLRILSEIDGLVVLELLNVFQTLDWNKKNLFQNKHNSKIQ